MAEDAVTKEDGGIRIKYYPHRIVVQAVTVSGMNGLKMFTNYGKSAKGVRSRYNISEDEWPIDRVHKMVDGTIYLVEFFSGKGE